MAYLIVSCVLYWRFLKPISPAGFYDGILSSLAADLLPTRRVVLCVPDAKQAERNPLLKQNIILVITFEVKFEYLFMHLLELVDLASKRKAAKLICSVMKVRFKLNKLKVSLHGP